MEFSNCDDVLQFMKNNYCKLLIVNLKENTYCPKIIADDEWSALHNNLTHKLSDYVEWFCNSDFIHTDDKEKLRNFFKYAREGKSITYRRKINGYFRRVLLLLQPTLNKNEVLLYVRDIDDIYNREKERIDEIDNMTGLYNKYAFKRDCKIFEHCSTGIIFCDLNALKYTNDTKGHKAGDELILRLANTLKLCFGDYKCYHLSGDEFIVAGFNCSLQKFLAKAMSFHKTMWTAVETPLASIGYSICEADIDTIESAVQEAEKGMYDDKLMFYTKYPQYKAR